MGSIEVKEIEFEKDNYRFVSEKYPENGFYISAVRNTPLKDLFFIEKENKTSIMIAPYGKISGFVKKHIPQPETTVINNTSVISEQFVLSLIKIITENK